MLEGLSSGRALDEIAGDLRLMWDEPTGFSGDVLLELAVEAFLAVGATRRVSLDLDRIDERFHRYAEQEGLIEHSPAIHVRRPRLDYESHAVGLDRNELGAMLVAAGLAGARDHALIALLALNGLRASEAIGADIGMLGLERGHRTLTVVRKGGKTVTMPLAPRTARTVDLAIGDRHDGPILLRGTGTDSTGTPPPASCGAPQRRPG